MTNIHKAIGIALISAGCTLFSVLYMRSPWEYSAFEFLIQPFVYMTFPMIVIGVITIRANLLPFICLLISIVIFILSIVVICISWDWPAQGIPTSQEDSFGNLAIIEVSQLYITFLWIAFTVVYIVLVKSKKITTVKR